MSFQSGEPSIGCMSRGRGGGERHHLFGVLNLITGNYNVFRYLSLSSLKKSSVAHPQYSEKCKKAVEPQFNNERVLHLLYFCYSFLMPIRASNHIYLPTRSMLWRFP